MFAFGMARRREGGVREEMIWTEGRGGGKQEGEGEVGSEEAGFGRE